MRSHTKLSVRQGRQSFTWMVREVQRNGRAFVVTVNGVEAAAVVPVELLQLDDARSKTRARKLARLLRQLAPLLPGMALPADRQRRARRATVR